MNAVHKATRRSIQLAVIAASLLAIASSNTECDGEGTPLYLTLKEIHLSLERLEDAVCHHYELSGDPLPGFCPTISPCDEPTDVGPCRAIIPRWTYNAETGMCERFEWGGCQANGNNFMSREECEGTCIPCEVDCKPHQECRQYEHCDSTGACELEDYCADTCRGVECGAGEVCRLEEVVCVRDPCPPVAVCVPIDPDPCALIDCKPGYVCEEQDVVCVTEPCPPIGVCVPQNPDPCALVRCAAGTMCHEVTPLPPCTASSVDACRPVAMCLPDDVLTCNDIACIATHVCEMQEVVCVTEPCYPVPTCVDVTTAPR